MITYALEGATGRLDELTAGERAVFTALNQLTQPLDVRQRCAATLAAAETLFDATAAWILLHDEIHHHLEVILYRGEGLEASAGIVMPEDEGLVGHALMRREIVFVPRVSEERGRLDVQRLRLGDVPTLLLAPLVSERRPVGVLALASPRYSETQPPSGPDLARLEALAALAAVTIENARLFEHSERDREQLRDALEQRRQLREEVAALRSEASPSSRHLMIGSSPAMDRVRADIDIVARADSTVLLTGETGTGKELVARAIHAVSHRHDRPFVPVNCAALPEPLVESELFGHERGAFTGAVHARPGKFELAHRGTLFLDEVGDLPPEAQAKLLRVLQDGYVERVGSTRGSTVDVRIVAATNTDLEQAMASGRFREDLYYRLSVFPIALPPLRERRSDIPLLAMYFATRCGDQVGKSIEGFTPDVIDRLMAHPWPGNVRELQNVVERAVLLTTGPILTPASVTVPSPRRRVPQADPPPSRQPASPGAVITLADADRQAILRALETSGWRVSGPGGAARILGVKPTTLHSKMKRLGINRPRVRLPSTDERTWP